MKRIALFAPDQQRLSELQQLLSEYQDEIIFEVGFLANAVTKAKKLLAQNVEIILARGQTAIEIRDSFPALTVVDIPITGFDLVIALEKARSIGSHVAVIAFPIMASQIECLESAVGVTIKKYNIQSRDHINAAIDDAIKNGADVLLGGYATGQVASQRGIPYVQVVCGNQAYIEAFHNAKRILASIHEEKRKAGLIRTVLNHAYEGIVSVDEKCRIVALNPVAERIVKFPPNSLGRNLNDIWPDLRLDRILTNGKEELNGLYQINGVQILCNKVPIKDERKVIGAVVTFQDITKIQMMEARIRKEVYSKGHVATFSFKDIYGSSSAICSAINEAKSYSVTDANVLIIGETGVGKEVFAQSIHNNSKRARGPFVAVNCAALPAQLLESELFGYVGGAFTGASKEGKTGLFEVAHTGTIFLDEIGEMDYINQGRLLRVLQERSVMRLGSDRVIPVDVRVIAATNKNLQQLVSENKFREDLYYRLNVLHLKIPALCERKKDISLYAIQFLNSISQNKLKLSKAASKVLEEYTWPGNIRELRNVIERIVALSQRNTISAAFICKILNIDNSNASSQDIKETKEIVAALESCNGKIGDVAELMKISRSTLWRKMKRLGINA
ncbi:sigma 54-interacting transcriptional regulator [Sporomusa malonica]|nr:sigma 54-interacting transcriptional regulator [Sporomusa malonica]